MDRRCLRATSRSNMHGFLYQDESVSTDFDVLEFNSVSGVDSVNVCRYFLSVS